MKRVLNFFINIAIIAAIVLIIKLFKQGKMTPVIDFIKWLFALKNSNPDASIAAKIISRLLSYIFAFLFVATIFDFYHLYHSPVGRVICNIFSILVTFILFMILKLLEKYAAIFCYGLGGLTVIFIIIDQIIQKKEEDFDY